jgi:S1-C subfamily serine protease
LLTKGHISYAYVGVQSEDLTASLARHLQLPVAHGALVDSVSAGGPAAAAGLRGGTHAEQFQGQTVTVGGDVIVAVDGRPIASAADLVRIVTNTLRPGQTALFSVVRGSSRRAIAVTLTARSPR